VPGIVCFAGSLSGALPLASEFLVIMSSISTAEAVVTPASPVSGSNNSPDSAWGWKGFAGMGWGGISPTQGGEDLSRAEAMSSSLVARAVAEPCMEVTSPTVGGRKARPPPPFSPTTHRPGVVATATLGARTFKVSVQFPFPTGPAYLLACLPVTSFSWLHCPSKIICRLDAHFVKAQQHLLPGKPGPYVKLGRFHTGNLSNGGPTSMGVFQLWVGGEESDVHSWQAVLHPFRLYTLWLNFLHLGIVLPKDF
jgi:hypothetical protein